MGKVFIDWGCSRDKYETIFSRIEKSNLLQSWPYGDAKKAAEGWNIHRAVIFRESEEIAVLQVLSKNILFMRICRINRGPMFLRADAETIRQVHKALQKYFSVFKGRLLIWAPEANSLKSRLRSYHWRKNPIRSAWVSLKRTEAEILASLDGKWRNQMLKARKSNVTIDDSDGADEFQWLLDQHMEERQERKFPGLAPELILALRASGTLKVIIANHGGKKIGGIMVGLHGTSATYIIGYNNIDGRKLNANNLLLYHSLIKFKEDYAWFDVGGLGESLAGINNFKRGLKGAEYELFGEYIIS